MRELDRLNRKIKAYTAGVTILFLIERHETILFLTLKVEKYAVSLVLVKPSSSVQRSFYRRSFSGTGMMFQSMLMEN